ncbi:HAD-IIIC family phosphatase [Streptomyces venezuelae]|uniref:HAD-IIIC family phosphatase n=1 Tax=Streptomyces venezuelae TaxID=54571 RepID=UPI0016804BC8|nr:HAD-IIIC family phosphatase [Streptomyces venezuelae]
MPSELVKCVVWDLDDTVWEGILSEGPGVKLRPGIRELIETLDERGILQSIASKNDEKAALDELERLGIREYFLVPHVSWQPKSALIQSIAERLNIGIDTLMFVDDSAFERAEVEFVHPQVRCVDAAETADLLDRPELTRPVTEDGRARRMLYLQAEERKAYETSFAGPQVEFLRSLDMRLTIAVATPEDLERAAELTERTHQLNTTGLTFSKAELRELMERPDQTLLVARLTDRFGTYGTIGLTLVGRTPDEWRIRLFLMSCRVMGRNVGGAILRYLAQSAEAEQVRLTADFRPTDVNKAMYTVYRLAGFKKTAVEDPGAEGSGHDASVKVLRMATGLPHTYPDYLTLSLPEDHALRSAP